MSPEVPGDGLPGTTTLMVADMPTVTGPIAATTPLGDPARGYPFFATTVELGDVGYVEQEFFLEGTANRYDIPGEIAGIDFDTAKVVDSGHPYRTRIVVRRPSSKFRFNGTVIVEWLNVTLGYDADIDWWFTHDHLTRAGYAWVGVSAQRVGVQQLRAWSPARYGTLDVNAADAFPGDKDALSYDIFSHAAAAVRGTSRVKPLGPLQVKNVIATGHSQSAYRLTRYANLVQPLTGLVDGFILHGSLGNRIRTDLPTPVWKLLTETEVVYFKEASSRQPDTATYRTWEVAGTSHADTRFAEERAAPLLRDLGVVASPTCDVEPFSHIPFRYVMNAAYDHMVRWVSKGVAPPSAPPLSLATASPIVLQRDARGNALGGIQLSQHAVATATNRGDNPTPACYLVGSYVPFDGATLDALYPRHGVYVARVTDATIRNRRAGYLTFLDAIQTISEAARSASGGPPGFQGHED